MEVFRENPIAIPSTFTSRRHHLFKIILRKRCWHFKALKLPEDLHTHNYGRVEQQNSWKDSCFFLSPCLLWRCQAPSPPLNTPSSSSSSSSGAANTVSCSALFPRGGRASRQSGLPAAGCCRGKSLAATAQPSLSFPARDQAPACPHPKQNFQPRAILRGSHLRRRTSLQWKYWKKKPKEKASRTFFPSHNSFLWHFGTLLAATAPIEGSRAFLTVLWYFSSRPSTWASFSNSDLPPLIWCLHKTGKHSGNRNKGYSPDNPRLAAEVPRAVILQEYAALTFWRHLTAFDKTKNCNSTISDKPTSC